MNPFMDLYCMAPAAKGMHHVYLGGLLEHSLALVKLVKTIVPLYGGINEDLLIVGALLHDVGKVHEMSYERAFDYTDIGKLLGHITIGVELVEERIRQVEGFPRELGILLKHMLLSPSRPVRIRIAQAPQDHRGHDPQLSGRHGFQDQRHPRPHCQGERQHIPLDGLSPAL